MEELVRQRIKELISFEKNVTLTSLGGSDAAKMQLSRQINGSTSISLGTILLIVKKIPNVSTEWLLRGVGEMYLPSNDNDTHNNKATIEQQNDYSNNSIVTLTNKFVNLLSEKDKQIANMQAEIIKLLDIISENERRKSEYQQKTTMAKDHHEKHKEIDNAQYTSV